MSYKTVAVDFDGVISQYDRWRGLGVFGPLMEGCREELLKLRNSGWSIIIFTTRGLDIEQVRAYLDDNQVPYDSINHNMPGAPDNVSDRKVLASVYIDDRAINFDGRWVGMADKVLGFKPHYLQPAATEGYTIEVAKDLERYAWTAASLEPFNATAASLRDVSLYEAYMPELIGFLNSQFVAPSHISRAVEVLRSLAAQADWSVREEAYSVFEHKNRQRGGLWKGVGLTGAIIEIHAKLARLKHNCSDRDSLVDLFNYVIIGLMCCNLNNIRPAAEGSPRPVIMITGATGSLGETLCQVFSLNGFRVIKAPQAKSFGEVDEFLDDDMRINYFINNHGTNHLNWIGNLGAEDFAVLDTNLKMPLYWVDQLVGHGLFVLPTPRILNICSQTYRVPQRCTAAYCASKAGLAHLTKVMARELAPTGFVVNALAPGKIEDTRMAEITDQQVLQLRQWKTDDAEKYSISNVPMRRYTSREEVALAAIQIMHLPPYVNGAVIDMTGGQ